MKQVKWFFTKRQRPNPNESGEEYSQIPITNQSIPSVFNPNATPQTPITNQSISSVSNAIPQTQCSNQPNDNVDLKDLPKDPVDRPLITSYKPNIRDDVRRAYLLQGPCQNSAYCLYCYLCGDLMEQKGGRDAFVSQGFDTWNKTDAFRTHVGGVDSFHNKAKEKCEFLMREKQAINVVLRRQTEVEDHKYKARLRVSIIVVRLLLKTELVQCFPQEVLLSIREEIGQDVFALLVDDSSDVSKKEQMAIVLRYVDSLSFVKERFIGLVHVKDTSSLTLKNAINKVITKNDTAFYVHCFAHQLQLVVAVAKKHDGVSDFFEQISLVVNVVCASCKRKYLLREQAIERVQKGFCSGELETGVGLNQETTLVGAGETR
ncbi:uncharacterized protein LOC111890290 [Lactuca sativa]|uniref:uncharacterized protein LOC111890290 n=1 Tax=Lactuca sativa TaxID=4236 RepID=UPI0022B07799|nr:uncharacterized protein LOC111890290 [Lactuca sativa]